MQPPAIAQIATGVQYAKNIITFGWPALGPAIALSSCALVLICLRWLTRLFIIRKVGLDDWLLSAAMTCCLGLTAGIAIQFFLPNQVDVSEDGHGGYIISITPEVAKLVIANNVLYSATTNLTKCSIVVQYLRLFSERSVRIVCYTLLSLLAISGMYGIFSGIFICRPVHKFWYSDAEGHCENAETLWMAGAGLNVPLDCAVWITPMPVIGKLRLPRRQMISVAVVFALGGFICATSVARLVIVHTAALRHEITKAGVSSLQWSAIEANVGIICASLMALKPLILRFAPGLMAPGRPTKHAMRINTITDDDTLSVSFWAGGSVSTTCVGSDATEVTMPSKKNEIKVTTEMEQTTVEGSMRNMSALSQIETLRSTRMNSVI